MAEESQNSEKPSMRGPDLFGYYKHEILDLLTDNENWASLFSSSSTTKDASPPENGTTPSLFSNTFQDTVPDFKKDLLTASLRQSVAALRHEFDEMIAPVQRIHRFLLRLHSKRKQSFGGESLVNKVSDSMPPCKKLRSSSLDAKKDSLVEKSIDADEESGEASEDLKLLLESDDSLVEEIMTKQSDEFYGMLNYMEKQLEELLDAVFSKCRLMTRQEKQQLSKVIQKLPTQNLDRVLEIILRGNSAHDVSSNEIIVDLEKQDNATLWRLYLYTKAVENAREVTA